MSAEVDIFESVSLREIGRIEFGLLSPAEIRSYSVVEIKHRESWENRRPKDGGLFDLRLGCIERNQWCLTCSQEMKECPGHFGHIELARPVFHVSYIERVKKVLECVCHKCARIKVPRRDPLFKRLMAIKSPKRRFNAVWRACKTKVACEYTDCGYEIQPVRRDGGQIIVGKRRGRGGGGNGAGGDDDAPDRRKVFTATEVHRIFTRISDADCHLLGLDPKKARPEWMILTVLPVPPPCVRPSVSIHSGVGRGEDDLTYKLCEILRYNKEILKSEADPSSNGVAMHEEQLQYHVATYMDNETSLFPKATQKGGRPIKSIATRWGGKYGRLRGNGMGKRVDFTARTVITGDPNLGLHEVGVPIEIAMKLTYPERVTNYNIQVLQEIVNNGPLTYPGAMYVVDAKGGRRDLTFVKTMPRIKVGDTVERHMRDGDLVLFNRQPTLHRPSMMCHRVRVMKGRTFRLNLSVTTPYNADFDGDEMNLHLPQSSEPMAELSVLSKVTSMVVSPQANRPCMGIVQDALCAVYKFTRRDVFLTREEVFRLLMKLPMWDGKVPTPCVFKPKPLWTGKQIFSLLLPKCLSFNGLHSAHPSTEKDPLTIGDTRVVISNGELLTGIICKKSVGTSGGSLIHIIWQDYGPDAVGSFFDGCQFLVNEWMLHHGFSVGLGDCVTDRATQHTIDAVVNGAVEKVDKLTLGGKVLAREVEGKVCDVLSDARDAAGKVAVGFFGVANNFKQMVSAGSKGSNINISQIAAAVGQQNVEGGRVSFGFRDRALPYFAKGDNAAEARGFVKSSYIRGLQPTEFFFHAMGGREGIIDTSVKTSVTGYTQRRLVKALEDVTVSYDGTVRVANGTIVQFKYGEDGMDGTSIEKQRIDLVSYSDDEILRRLSTLPPEIEQLKRDRDYLRYTFKTDDTDFQLPVNVSRILQRSKVIVPRSDECTTLTYDDAFMIVSEGITRINSFELFSILIRYNLASKVLVDYHKLTKEQLCWTLEEVRHKFARGHVHPGEGIGVIAAQSIGEPTTQMTLNTFHSAGIANKTVTLGVPRLLELINTKKNLETPMMTVYLEEPYCQSPEGALMIARQLRRTVLGEVVASSDVHPDADVLECSVETDRQWCALYWSLPEHPVDHNSLSPWLLRLEIDRKKMIQFDLSLDKIVDSIREALDNDAVVYSCDDNELVPVIHIRLEREQETDDPNYVGTRTFLYSTLTLLLENVMISGIAGIEDATVSDKPKRIPFTAPDGSIDYKVEWYVETSGINLREVTCVNGVDCTRIISNNPMDTLEVFGIEAAREVLIRELRHVIEYDGSYVNYRHLALLADVMTNRGEIMSITRHGINRLDSGPLKKCTFEETQDVLMEAALNAEVDNLQGVSENILMGKLVPAGTGTFDIAFNDDIYEEEQPVTTSSQLDFDWAEEDDGSYDYGGYGDEEETSYGLGRDTPVFV